MRLKEKIPDKGFWEKGHNCCKGCPLPIAARHILNILEPKAVVNPACCFTVVSSNFPYTALGGSYFTYTPFAMAATVASGIEIGLRDSSVGKEKPVIVIAGDGGTYDIGFDKVSASAERGDDIIYVCLNNEAYMNTGIQRSSATPWGAATTTTLPPFVKKEQKKDIIGILAAHRVSYAATLNFAYINDFVAKIKKAKEKKGFRFLLIMAPCPSGWGFPPDLTVKISRLAVESGAFPLYETEDGKYKITFEPKFENRQEKLEEYLKAQGRFSHLKEEDIEKIYNDTLAEQRRLKALEQLVY